MAKNAATVKKTQTTAAPTKKATAAAQVRKKAFGPRSLRSHYSNRTNGLTVRAWVGKSDFLIRDDRGVEVDVPEEEIDGLITALIDLKRKKQQKEVKA